MLGKQAGLSAERNRKNPKKLLIQFSIKADSPYQKLLVGSFVVGKHVILSAEQALLSEEQLLLSSLPSS